MPQQSQISFPMGTKNVLIIDGNEAMQQLRARVLEAGEFTCTRPKASRKRRCSGCLSFSIWYYWMCARDPKKQWSSGERSGASIQGSGSVSWSDPQCICLLSCADEVVSRDKVPEDWVQRPGVLHVA